jgi:hypothetical protein
MPYLLALYSQKVGVVSDRFIKIDGSGNPYLFKKVCIVRYNNKRTFIFLINEVKISIFLISRLFVGSSRINISGDLLLTMRQQRISRIFSPPLRELHDWP